MFFGCSWLVVAYCFVVRRFVVRRFVDRRVVVPRSPFAVRRLPFVVVCCLLLVVCWLSFVGWCFLVVCFWLFVVGCRLLFCCSPFCRSPCCRSPFAVRRLSFVVVCCLLLVVCWLSFVGWSFLVVDCWLFVVGCRLSFCRSPFCQSPCCCFATKRYQRLITGFCTYAVETGTLRRPEPIITHATMRWIWLSAPRAHTSGTREVGDMPAVILFRKTVGNEAVDIFFDTRTVIWQFCMFFVFSRQSMVCFQYLKLRIWQDGLESPVLMTSWDGSKFLT